MESEQAGRCLPRLAEDVGSEANYVSCSPKYWLVSKFKVHPPSLLHPFKPPLSADRSHLNFIWIKKKITHTHIHTHTHTRAAVWRLVNIASCLYLGLICFTGRSDMARKGSTIGTCSERNTQLCRQRRGHREWKMSQTLKGRVVTTDRNLHQGDGPFSLSLWQLLSEKMGGMVSIEEQRANSDWKLELLFFHWWYELWTLKQHVWWCNYMIYHVS